MTLASSSPAVVTRGLTKEFGAQRAVAGIDLEVPRGAVFGFLGPNGSGKTTTIRMLLGLVVPSAGEVDVLGAPMPRAAAEVLPRVGALVEGPAFHPHLSARANLARLDSGDVDADPRTRTARIDACLERVGLAPAGRKRVRAYSLGMKQRLGIAATLLRPRDLLLLDEPTNGLDPQGTREIRALVRSLADEGATVVVSSHLLSEVEQMCTHVGVMSAGRLVSQGPLAEVVADRRRLRLSTPDVDAAMPVLVAAGLTPQRDGDDGLSAALPSGVSRPDVVPPLVAALVAAGVRVTGIGVESATLEDAFVELTGEGFDVAG